MLNRKYWPVPFIRFMNSASDQTGIVFDIQRAALDDGPGLRTVVFLKGCPLRCAWCHNPESWEPKPQTGISGKIYGKTMTVSEVMHEVKKDMAFYQTSGGGLTLSGGEPTVQFDFCLSLLRSAKDAGISTCLDTCGHCPPEKFSRLLPLVDIWHFDLKATGEDMYKKWTGRDGTLIEENLNTLIHSPARIRLRCPIVPGIHNSSDHETRLDKLEQDDRIESLERLPYHELGEYKYTDLGILLPALPG